MIYSDGNTVQLDDLILNTPLGASRQEIVGFVVSFDPNNTQGNLQMRCVLAHNVSPSGVSSWYPLDFAGEPQGVNAAYCTLLRRKQ